MMYVNFQLSIVNCQMSTVNYFLPKSAGMWLAPNSSYFLPKSAGISPQASVSHLRMGVV